MPLVLGDFIFQDMEIPEKISGLGGKQAAAKHKLIGGARVVDAMGPDDGDPEWSGRFRGELATPRAQQLDEMRRSGQQFALSFGSFFYQVMIEEFTFDYERAYQIIYKIKLFVISAITPDAEPSLDDLVTSDLGALSGLIGQFTAAV